MSGHDIEVIKQDRGFDEAIAEQLARGAGRTSPEDIERYIRQVREKVDRPMHEVAERWDKEDQHD